MIERNQPLIDMLTKLSKHSWIVEILFLIIISGLVYLPNIGQLTYYRDDWTYAYDAHIGGADIYKIKFIIDRPVRGYFFALYHTIFGAQPFPYHIGAYIWRLVGAFGALWLFNILWHRQRFANFCMALLFLIYPGFLWWPAGIEYQPMIASAGLQILSIVFTLLAIQSAHTQKRVFLWGVSLFSGWVALLLVDYAIGMEVFRILCVFLHVSQSNPGLSVSKKIGIASRVSIIPLAVPLLFVFWKVFIFHGERKTTDIAYQLSFVVNAPLETILLWGKYLWISTLSSVILPWWTPLQRYLSSFDQRYAIYAYLFAAANMLWLWICYYVISRTDKVNGPNMSSNRGWHAEAIIVGFFGMIFGLLPIVIANRYFAFNAFSHYGLPASLAAVVFVVGLCRVFTSNFANIVVISLLVGLSTFTHHALVTNVIKEEKTIQEFWWQVYWRAPSLKEGTLLVVNYPALNYGGDVGMVMGPANFMYFPSQVMGGRLVDYALGAVELSDENIQNIIEGTMKKSSQYRSHKAFLNFKNVLVLTQPSIDSCVHVIDNRWSESSSLDTDQIISILPYSDTGRIDLENSVPAPLEFIFGSEISYSWCYYYERADLARQQGDWQTVATIGSEAIEAGYVPKDLVEWLPFIEAYAVIGDATKVEQVASYLIEDPYYRKLACDNMHLMPTNGFPIGAHMQAKLDSLLCSP